MELSASELRIGNYVTVDNQDSWRNLEGVTLLVTGINNHMDSQDLEFFPDSDGKVSLKSEYETYGQFSQFIKPIPLTEEWLLKFGFEIHFNTTTNRKYKINDLLSVQIINNEFYLVIGFAEKFKCDYVHQLQNLYFALCGEELELN